VVEALPGTWQVARTYLALGVEHILAGIDHLLFVFALLLLVKGTNRLIATITAFTIAHSLTLAAATLGWVHVPAPPVEAAIALSIVFLAVEIIRSQRGTIVLTQQFPWIIALIFGLLHGFGFAGALSEVGLPQSAIPVALMCFNIGVEIGQLIFVASVIALMKILRHLQFNWPASAKIIPPYLIGSCAAFWVIQRLTAF
jgi:hydrogenase/urease accessory protein HupE